MKREGGINGRDDKSSGIDIRMADALAGCLFFYIFFVGRAGHLGAVCKNV
jgi:hypothetical protein